MEWFKELQWVKSLKCVIFAKCNGLKAITCSKVGVCVESSNQQDYIKFGMWM